VLGAQVVETGHISETKTDVTVLDLGGIHLELLSSREPDTKVGRLLRERGEGIHHLSFEVNGISERLAELRSRGIKLLDEVPRRGLHDRQIAFLAPQDTSGILIELAEENS
jgi:methylmalonyl-CoA/ethylmalonyl-CoA epimerase